jgi:hypothetical protein
MAVKNNINGVLVAKPDVYSIIKSGVKNPSPGLAYGNLCIIDTGFGAGYGGGSGITGDFSSGLSSIYALTNPQDWQAFVKGGELWNFTNPLFKPYPNVAGVSKIYFIRACTTVAASVSFSFSASTAVFKVKDEGLVGNGILSAGNLIKGYAIKVTAGIIDPTKYVFTFYVGSYRGFDTNNNTDYYLSTTNSAPIVAITSPEVASVAELISWSNSNNDFTSLFSVVGSGFTNLPTPTGLVAVGSGSGGTLASATYYYKVTALNGSGETVGSSEASYVATGSTSSISLSWTAVPGATSYKIYRGTTTGAENHYFVSTVASFVDTGSSAGTAGAIPVSNTAVGPGILVAGDLSTYVGYNLLSGGTETYNDASFQAVLSAITNLDNNFFLSLEFGNNATSVNNFSILSYLQTAKFKKFLVVAGGADKTTFTGANSSILAAQTIDDEKAIVVHGKCKIKNRNTSGYKTYSQLYKAALITGRLCGLAPQVPVTWKALSIDGEVHILSDSEIENAISNGVLYTNYDYELNNFVVGLDINTLQDNDNLVNDDGTSYNIAVNRITSQLNRLIVVAAKQRFFSGENGPNRNTVTPEDIQSWLEGFLQAQTATTLKDNLILRAGNVVVSISGTSYYVSYEFVPNFEVAQIIFTGTLLES